MYGVGGRKQAACRGTQACAVFSVNAWPSGQTAARRKHLLGHTKPELHAFGASMQTLIAPIKSDTGLQRRLYLDIFQETGEHMGSTSQKRALENYRARLREQGLSRFEVLALDGDRELIRSLAKRLAQDDAQAAQLRTTLANTINGEPTKPGGILARLRRSPMVGANIEVTREQTAARKLDL